MTNNTNRLTPEEIARIARALRTPSFDPLKGRRNPRRHIKHNHR